MRNQHCLLASSTIQQCGNRSLWVIKHILVFFRDGNAPFWWLKNELVICWDGNFLLPTTLVVVYLANLRVRVRAEQSTRSLNFVSKPQKFKKNVSYFNPKTHGQGWILPGEYGYGLYSFNCHQTSPIFFGESCLM